MNSKQTRLEGRILWLIRNHVVEEQSQLQKLLAHEGFNTPQATLSRRLKQLRVVKVNGKYQAVEQEVPATAVSFPILKIDLCPPNLVVVHTIPGHASSMGYFIDKKYGVKTKDVASRQKGVLGTISGHDTLLVVVENIHALRTLADYLEKLNSGEK